MEDVREALTTKYTSLTHSLKHTFIHHPHRYSHLRKYTYLLQAKGEPVTFNGLVEYRKTERLRFVHPISMLSCGARSLPPDFSLEAADCLSLYHALRPFRGQLAFNLDALDPTRFFAESKGTILKQKDVLRYEAALTEQVLAMLESTDPQDQNSVLNVVVKTVSDPMIDKADQRYVPASGQFYTNLIALVADLQASDDLASSLEI